MVIQVYYIVPSVQAYFFNFLPWDFNVCLFLIFFQCVPSLEQYHNKQEQAESIYNFIKKRQIIQMAKKEINNFGFENADECHVLGTEVYRVSNGNNTMVKCVQKRDAWGDSLGYCERELQHHMLLKNSNCVSTFFKLYTHLQSSQISISLQAMIQTALSFL